MKRPLSLISCLLILTALIAYRVITITPEQPLKVTLWDANGYYLYLPSILIYHDYTELKWADSIDNKYHVTGGNGIQAQKADNGNSAFKYLGGVALMELPLFGLAHVTAKHSHYPPDGFSPPYQYALGFGVILYSFLALLVLRRVLLYYFSDKTVAITLLLTGLATNYIQYAAVDNGQSHGYIFLLYALVLLTTLRWHTSPGWMMAIVTGYICGLATMSRPTEAIIIFIPLFWNTHNKEAAKDKWQLVKQHKSHIYLAALGGFLGILPQLLYWKAATGSFVYDVGSKWQFLNPWWRVLFGFEKGWFIYTPVTVFFVVGMFFMKGRPFMKSVLWFCLLNIYIIIAWDDWRYGGSYSTRALVQSYPAFTLPLACLVDHIRSRYGKALFLAAGLYLTGVNLFQLWQYDNTVLHFNDMNRRYYAHIYLNPHPSPLDMSLLDNDELLSNPANYHESSLCHEVMRQTRIGANAPFVVIDNCPITQVGNDSWLKIESNIKCNNLWQAYLYAEVTGDGNKKSAKIRLFNAISNDQKNNDYALWMKLPPTLKNGRLRVYLQSPFDVSCTVNDLRATLFSK